MRKCISITDVRVLNKLSTVRNMSAYITELILNDISDGNSTNNEQLVSMIVSALSSRGIVTACTNEDMDINLQAVLDIINA